MGDYKYTRNAWYISVEEEEHKPIYVEVKMESRGVPYILITQSMWREIGGDEGIYRLELSNDESHEYYVYYPGEGKVKLSISGLNEGEIYELVARKVDIDDIIEEMSHRIADKYGGMQLKMNREGELYLILPSGKSIKIDEYKLEQPRGGEARLLIKIRGSDGSQATIQIVIVDNEVEMRFISSIQERGKITRPVERIYEIGEFLAIKYWKAPKYSTSYILLSEKLDPDSIYKHKAVISNYFARQSSKDEVNEYNLIIESDFSEYIKAIYRLASMSNIPRYNVIKEKLGLIIAEDFLSKMGYDKIERHPLRRHRLKGPDLIAWKDGFTIFEVKITKVGMLDLKYNVAVDEIRRHVYRKYADLFYLKNIKRYGVIVIALPTKFRIPLKLHVYFSLWRIRDDSE